MSSMALDPVQTENVEKSLLAAYDGAKGANQCWVAASLIQEYGHRTLTPELRTQLAELEADALALAKKWAALIENYENRSTDLGVLDEDHGIAGVEFLHSDTDFSA